MAPGRSLALVALLGATAATTGCGGSPKSSSAGSGAPKRAAVTIKGYAYHPARLLVRAGARVTFTNADSSEHTATKESGFDTGTLRRGARRTVTLDKPGTYRYICSFHPFMHGTIVVR